VKVGEEKECEGRGIIIRSLDSQGTHQKKMGGKKTGGKEKFGDRVYARLTAGATASRRCGGRK